MADQDTRQQISASRGLVGNLFADPAADSLAAGILDALPAAGPRRNPAASPESFGPPGGWRPSEDTWRKYGLEPPEGPAADAPQPPAPAPGPEGELDRATEQQVIEAASDYDNPHISWIDRAARSATFGLTDTYTAMRVQSVLAQQGHDLSYQQTLRIVRGINDAEQGLGSELAGSLVPGIGIVKGGALVGRGAMAVGRMVGLVERQQAAVNGAMRAVASSNRVGRVLGGAARAAGGGAAGVGVYEAARQSVSELITGVAGDEPDPERVVDAALEGAIIGAVAGPVLMAAGGAVSNVAAPVIRTAGDWLAAISGSETAASRLAGRRLSNTLSRYYGGSEEEALGALTRDVQTYMAANDGRVPTLTEILPIDMVRDLTASVRTFAGLGARATANAELAMKDVQANIANYLERGAGHGRIVSARELRESADDAFDVVMREHGDTLVQVPDAVVSAMEPHMGWLSSMASGQRNSTSAARIMEVLTARRDLGQARATLEKLANARDIAEVQHHAADMGNRYAERLFEIMSSGAVPPSEMAALKAMQTRLQALGAAMDRMAKLERADEAMAAAQNIARDLQATLSDFASTGLRVPLRDVSTLRSIASDASWSAQRSGDMLTGGTMREASNALSDVGVREVPAYREAVRDFSEMMTAAENMTLGRHAVRGTRSESEIRSWSVGGKTDTAHLRPGTQSASGADRYEALQFGGRAGLLEETHTALRGTSQEAGRLLLGVRNSEGIRNGIRTVMRDADPETLLTRLNMGADSIERLSALAGTRSIPTSAEAAEVANVVSDILFAPVSGGAKRSSIIAGLWNAIKLPRPAASRLVDMLTDPKQVENALIYMDRHGVDRARFFGSLIAASAKAQAALSLSGPGRGVLPGVGLLTADENVRRQRNGT